LPGDSRANDCVVYFRGARVPPVVREIGQSVPHPKVASCKLRQVRKQLLIHKNITFMHCKIIGECVINGFEDIEEEAFAPHTGGTALHLEGRLRGLCTFTRSSLSKEATRHRSVDCGFVVY
jgi:hypothetical protein